jgi:uncharacterized membrane protein
VSLEGTLGGFVGALLVASVGSLLGMYSWSAALLVATAGLLGSLGESVIGALSGDRELMSNDLLNAANTVMGAAFVVLLVRATALVGLVP